MEYSRYNHRTSHREVCTYSNLFSCLKVTGLLHYTGLALHLHQNEAPPLVCLPGINTVSDRCGCCKVCAAQLNQDCSPTRPCDHYKGLECNYSNNVTMAWGICRAKSEGGTCEYNSRIYQNGESFHAGCKHQCTCIDSAVGCAPLCNKKLPPASLTCPYPRLVRIRRQCCFSMDCHKGILRFPHKYQVCFLCTGKHLPFEQIGKLFCGISLHVIELVAISNLWNQLKEKCPVQTTDWSQCSHSCGMGISYRITNNNTQCKLEKETRICTIRLCHALTVKAKKGKKCSLMQKGPESIRLSIGECVSVRLYRRTRTVPVTFVCPNGKHFQRSAMFIQSCKCSDDCDHLNNVVLPPQQWMYRDTHKFID
uniref:Uncharacterized protein n=1 Tax=Monopterus albus TaxID=43700 RepID=A0A3Q3KEQ5_MONAL